MEARPTRNTRISAALKITAVVLCSLVSSTILAQNPPLPHDSTVPTNPSERAGITAEYVVTAGKPVYVYRVGSAPGKDSWVSFTPPTDVKSFRHEMGVRTAWNPATSVQKYQLQPGTHIKVSVVETQAEVNPITGKFTVFRGGGIQAQIVNDIPPIAVDAPRSLPAEPPKVQISGPRRFDQLTTQTQKVAPPFSRPVRDTAPPLPGHDE